MEIRIANQDTLLSVETMVQDIQNKANATISSRATQASVNALLSLLGDENPTDANLFTVMNALKKISDAQDGGGGSGGGGAFGFIHDMRGYPPTERAWRRLNNTPVTLTNAEAIDCGDYILTLGMANTTSKVCYKYTPSTDTWLKIADAPDVVYKCHAVRCGAYFYVFFGYVSPYTKFYRYNIATETWEQLADLPTPMTSSSGVMVACGTDIYAIGGSASAYYRAVRRYDTLTNTWYTTGMAAPPFDINGGNGWSCNNEIYILHSTTAGSFAKYTPSTNTWKVLSNSPAPCSKTAHGVLGGKLILAGGDVNAYSHAWHYDPPSDTWSRIADNYHSMSGACGVTCGEKFYVFGTNYGYDTASKSSVYENPADSAMEQIVATVKAGQEIYYNVYGGYGFLSIQNSGGTYTEIPKGTVYVATRDAPLKSNMYSASGILRGWVR